MDLLKTNEVNIRVLTELQTKKYEPTFNDLKKIVHKLFNKINLDEGVSENQKLRVYQIMKIFNSELNVSLRILCWKRKGSIHFDCFLPDIVTRNGTELNLESLDTIEITSVSVKTETPVVSYYQGELVFP